MALRRLSAEEKEAIKQDLASLGVEGSALLAIAPFDRNADSHIFIREIIIAFLRSLFRNASDDYRWDPDEVNTKIHIHYADTRNTGTEKGATPAITVELGPYTWGNHSINNLLAEKADGTRYYTDLRNGSVIVRCRTSVKLEADSLAAVIAGAIHYMHEDLESMAGFVYVDAYTANPSSGELQQQNTQGETFVANVVVNVHYQETWKREPTRFIKDKVVFVQNPRGIILD